MANTGNDDDEDIAEELALERLTQAGADRAVASEFLQAKTDLLRAQHRQLHLGHAREWMYLVAELVVGFVILIVFIGLVGAIWSAAHDNGLVIESFSVPPDLAARGLTGQVVAAQLQDKLASLQVQTNSMRAASSYQNNWGNDIKVQIPETGVSIGEFNTYLRQWLGNETHINGEIYRTDSGIAVTARAGVASARTFTGKEADLSALLQKAAEAVYAKTQPYRYGVYLLNQNRLKEATATYDALIDSGSDLDRAWAYIGLSSLKQSLGDPQAAIGEAKKAAALRPDFLLAYINLASFNGQLQHDELALFYARKLAALLHGAAQSDINPAAVPSSRLANDAAIATSLGDFNAANAFDKQIETAPDYAGSIESARLGDLVLYGYLHDGAALKDAIAGFPAPTGAFADLNREAQRLVADALIGHWQDLLAMRAVLVPVTDKAGPVAAVFRERALTPLSAYALAMTGDTAKADALVATSPLDCDACLRVRGRIAQAEHRWADAERWFARVSARAPSVPFADTDWGRMLLAKGDADGAIAKFQSAHAKGPHFADPLEGWGEALMAKNRSDLALAKFAEAAKYAPNWGRLHLKWGEALSWSGDKEGAKKQFAMAATLDLAPAEKSELAKVSAHG